MRKTVTLLSASRNSELSISSTKDPYCTCGTSDVGQRVHFLIYNSRLANMTSCHAQGLLDVNMALEISDLNTLAQEFYDFDEKVSEKKKLNTLKNKNTYTHKKRKYCYLDQSTSLCENISKHFFLDLHSFLLSRNVGLSELSISYDIRHSEIKI